MSGRSGASGSVRSCAGTPAHEVVLDALYERKRDKKTVRVLTVIVYVFCVSLAAIMLSLYYVFFWEPKEAHYAQRKVHNVERQTGTTPMPTCFMPHTGGGDSTVNVDIPPSAIPIANSFENASSTEATSDLGDSPRPTEQLYNDNTSFPSTEDYNGTTANVT